MKSKIQDIKFIATKSSGLVTGKILLPEKPKFLLMFAHGAGAGMDHSFMERMSYSLYEKGVGTFRFNFPYTEKEVKRPDPQPILLETIRSAVKTAKGYSDGIPLLCGGKSMGGRMTSIAASKEPLDGVKGIVFLGFPLHAPGRKSDERAEHLYDVSVPMLFLQGTRDKLADLKFLKPVIKKLEDIASLHIIEGADHSFNMLKSSGKSSEDIFKELAGKTAEWGSDL